MIPYSVVPEPRHTPYIILGAVSLAIAFIASTCIPYKYTGITSLTVVAAGVFLAYDRWLWRLRPVAFLSGIPYLGGIWRGELTVPGRLEPVAIQLTITQRWSTIDLVCDSHNIRSKARIVGIQYGTPGDARVTWVYECEPKNVSAPIEVIDVGVTDLMLTRSQGRASLSGVYYSRVGNQGDFSVSQRYFNEG